MYQALYRKWRPRTFEDVVGQDHITATLRKQVETGRLSHAYLFIGTRGTGKTTCAKILARAVNCEHPVNGSPCNQCAACRGIESGSILDVVEMDAASNNKVDDVRALQDEAIFSPANVKKRVYIIDEVHMLSTAAFNALLKTLEEPPEHLMFILCTTELHKVLPTIVSRCQRHSFKRIEPDAIAGRLRYVAGQEGINLTEDAASMLARLADGGMRDALSLLDQCSAQEHIDADAVLSAMGLAGTRRTAELMQSVLNGDTAGALTRFNALWKDGKDPAAILDELADLMRDVLLLQVAPKGCDALLSGAYEKKTLERFAGSISGSQLMDSINAIRAADLSGSDPRRAAELCLVALCVPETGESVTALRNRVSRLEAALKGGIAAAPTAPPLSELPRPVSAAKAASAPAPVRDPAPQTEELPWYTDEDAPPENPEFVPPAPPSPQFDPAPEPAPDPVPPAAPEAKPTPPPSPVAGAGGSEWDLLVKRLNGKLNMGAYAMIATASQASGELVGNTMTVYLATPIAKLMLDTPATVSLFQQELQDITGHPVQVIFTDQPRPAAPAAENPKLDALSRFSNVTFE